MHFGEAAIAFNYKSCCLDIFSDLDIPCWSPIVLDNILNARDLRVGRSDLPKLSKAAPSWECKTGYCSDSLNMSSCGEDNLSPLLWSHPSAGGS